MFLFDVDNTLLDNDRMQSDLFGHIEKEFGKEARARYLESSRSCAMSLAMPTTWARWSDIGWRSCTIRVCSMSPTGWWSIRSRGGFIPKPWKS